MAECKKLDLIYLVYKYIYIYIYICKYILGFKSPKFEMPILKGKVLTVILGLLLKCHQRLDKVNMICLLWLLYTMHTPKKTLVHLLEKRRSGSGLNSQHPMWEVKVIPNKKWECKFQNDSPK